MAVLTDDELDNVYDENEYSVGLRSALLGDIIASDTFAADPAYFSDLSARLAAVGTGAQSGAQEAVYRARKLVGVVDKLNEIGPGELKIRGNEDAAYLEKRAEREAWIRYALGPLFMEKLTGAGGQLLLGPDGQPFEIRFYLPGGTVLTGSGPTYVGQRRGPAGGCSCYSSPCRCYWPGRLCRDG